MTKNLEDLKEPLSESILNTLKTLFIREFADVLLSSQHPSEENNQDIEQRIASVPGLMIALFSHIKEAKSSKKK
jgi:hypothetical protein